MKFFIQTALGCAVLIYAVGAFTFASWDISTWDGSTRGALAGTWALLTLAIGGAAWVVGGKVP